MFTRYTGICGGGVQCLRWLWFPGQHGSTWYPTNSKLQRQHQSTPPSKVQGCLSTKRDSFQAGSFAFQVAASSHCALHSITLHVQHNALSAPDSQFLHLTNTDPTAPIHARPTSNNYKQASQHGSTSISPQAGYSIKGCSRE